MYPDKATIEIFREGHWQSAATLHPTSSQQGYQGTCDFEYLIEYAAEYSGPTVAQQAGLSCRYPVDFDLHQQTRWPAFILDILPSGYGRQQWLEQLGLTDGPLSDWPLLMRGTAFPPGNLRIAEAAAAKDLTCMVPTATGNLIEMQNHPGFACEDVIERNENFVEYAHQHGIYAAGGSDVQGVAPKLLLAQDLSRAWHAEGVLADDQVQTCWLVKRPRGNTAADRQVLKNEAAYMLVARELGLNVWADLVWEDNNLFIPRFDRIVLPGGKVERLGMESLCSLAGIAEYGVSMPHNTLCDSIILYCTEPGRDLLEYIKRDIVNVVMGNKDNHARNSAVIRRQDGFVELSPLFDFAPMYLDPAGIARVCRWEGEAEQAGNPEWGRVLDSYPNHLHDARSVLRKFAEKLVRLPDIMRRHGVDEDIIEHRLKSIENHSRQLQAL
jgi:serine/threonine-protein kinase HipA